MKPYKKIFKVGAVISGAILLTFALTNTTALFAQDTNNETVATATGTTTGTETGVDAMAPSDVENLKAMPGDSEITLSWDPSTDNTGVTGYKIYRGTRAVQTSDDHYDLPVIPTGDVTIYTVKNLTNGKTYYFSATAVDSSGNESSNYALEASATPASGLRGAPTEDDFAAPQVKEVKAEDVITVLITFSEPVKLPEEHPVGAFQIETVDDKSRLMVQQVEIDSRDATGATVLLTTAPQVAGASYLVTAGIEVQDNFGNPVISGTSDTGEFKGSEKQRPQNLVAENETASTDIQAASEEPAASVDTTAPTIVDGAADFNNRIALNFSEKIKLPENPKSKFVVTKKGTGEELTVINVSLSVDGVTAYITTNPQEAVEYEVSVAEVTDEAGNLLAGESSTVTVSGKGSSLEDLVPPEDVEKLIARIKDAKNSIVELTWEASKNSAGDLADQLLYQSDDKEGAAYGTGASLGTSTTSADVQNLKSGSWYTFKIGVKDFTGNEGQGAVTSIYLPEVGPGSFAAGLTALFMGWYRRRKNK